MAGLALVGCAQPAATTNTDTMDTAIAGTLSVVQTQAAETNSANATQAAAAVVSAVELEPTATSTPISVITPDIVSSDQNSTSSSSGPSYRVGHVTDVTYEDGSFIDTNLHFTKSWKITNVGTGTWQADFKLVPVDNNPFKAPESTTINQVVSPGQSITLSLSLVCPQVAATYTGKFMLEMPDGTRFGIGSNFDEPFWLKITCHS